MKRNLSVLVALVVGVAASFVGVVSAEPPVAADETSSVVPMVEDASLVEVVEQRVADMVPLTPVRVLDTRTGLGVGGSGRVGAGGLIDLGVVGVGGVPVSGVAGVVFNLTATRASARTFVNAWPAGEVEPSTSVLNVGAGEVFANLVVAKVGDGGRVSLSNAFGEVHLLADVVGWIPTGSDLTTLTPARLLDTRSGVGVSSPGAVGAGGQVDLDVLGRGGVPASDVDSVLVNVTATRASQRSFVTLWPTGLERPTASVLNMVDAAPVPNLALAKVGDGGRISLFNRAGSAHLIVDVVGYTAEGSDVVALAPQRLLDTRSGLGVEAGRVAGGEFIDVTVVGVAGVPERGATAAIINVTAASPSQRSFVTTWPTGLPQPEASSLNMLGGENVANLVVATIGAGGKVRLFNAKGSTALIADVVGYVGVPDGVTAPVISDEVVVVSDEQLVSVDGDPDADDEVRIEVSGDAGVEVGSIMVIGATPQTPTGLLRRIVSVEVAADGSVVAVGVRATISDAIPEGSFALDTTFDPTAAVVAPGQGGAVSAMAQGTSVQDHPFQCGAGVSLSGSLDASADPSLTMQFDWDTSGVNSAQLTAGLDVVLDFSASATAQLGCSLSDSIFSVALPYIYVVIGGLPVVFVPKFEVELGVSASLEGSLSGSSQYRADVTAGVVYDETSGLSTVGSVTPTMTADWAAGAKAAASLALTPSISLLAYGLGGPKAGVTFGVGIDADPCRTPLWKATSSITSSIALTVGIPWLGSVDLGKADAILNESLLAEGGTAIPGFPGCDFNVEVVSHYYGVGASASADRVENTTGPGDRYFSDYLSRHSSQSGPDADGNLAAQDRTNVNSDITEVRTIVGPYELTSWSAAVAATAGVTGANASADASLAVEHRTTATTWEWAVTASVSASASASSDSTVGSFELEHNSFAGSEPAARVTVVLAEPAILTLIPRCPTIEAFVNQLPTDPSGCLDPVQLPAGQYQFSAGLDVGAEADDGSTDGDGRSGSALFVLTSPGQT